MILLVGQVGFIVITDLGSVVHKGSRHVEKTGCSLAEEGEVTDIVFCKELVLILFQSILIALVFFVAKHNRAEKQQKKSDSGFESSAIVAGLVVLGSGCPTCGTTLLAPILGTILSGASGSVALAGKLSLLLNFFAILLAIFVFKKLGFMTYAIIKSEHYLKKEKSHAKSN